MILMLPTNSYNLFLLWIYIALRVHELERVLLEEKLLGLLQATINDDETNLDCPHDSNGEFEGNTTDKITLLHGFQSRLL